MGPTIDDAVLAEIWPGREFEHATKKVLAKMRGDGSFRPEICRVTRINVRSITFADEQGRRATVSQTKFAGIVGRWV